MPPVQYPYFVGNEHPRGIYDRLPLARHSEQDGGEWWLDRLIIPGESGEATIKIAIFAGIHGDEPAGVLAIGDFLRALADDPSIDKGYELHIFPVCNPTGYADGTRHSRSGKDLNREFWRNSPEAEVRLLEEELRRTHFDGIISLHSDDTSDGFYAFGLGRFLTEQLIRPALAAAEKVIPINYSDQIDGFSAEAGMIRTTYEGVLSFPPECLRDTFEVILESPAHARMDYQRQSLTLALVEILQRYRTLISYAADI